MGRREKSYLGFLDLDEEGTQEGAGNCGAHRAFDVLLVDLQDRCEVAKTQLVGEVI